MSSIKGLGYHLKPIPKGRLGHISKIQEELMEYEDAIEQNCRIMAMVELSDLVGAIEAHSRDHYGLSLQDLKIMADITKRAFENGHR